MGKFILISFAFLSVVFAQTGIVKGFVYDKTTSEPIPYVNIYVKSNPLIGTTSNQSGYYVLFLPAGRYELVYSTVGYKRTEVEIVINQGQNLNVDVFLDTVLITIDTIVVEPKYNEPVNLIDFGTQKLKRKPFLSEFDLLKTLSALPGVNEFSELSSRLYIQGGYSEHNLILIDGIEVYGIEHLYGVFSIFNSEAVKNVRLIKGGYDASYGDRISSVIDLTLRDGNKDKLKGGVNLSLISTSGLIEGPVAKGSFLFSGRRTYFDLFKSLPDYYFFDLNFKSVQHLSNRLKLKIISFIAQDREQQIEARKTWEVKIFGIGLEYITKSNLFATLNSGYSFYGMLIDMGYNEIRDKISNFFISADIQKFTGFGAVKLGFNAKRINLHKFPAHPFYNFAFYSQSEINLHKFILYLGLRAYNSSFHKSLNPRVSFKTWISHHFAVQFAYGIYSQYLVRPDIEIEYRIEDTPIYPEWLTSWMLIEKGKEPLKSFHYVLTGDITAGNINLKVEMYFKDFRRVYVYFYSEPIKKFEAGKGRSFGLDILIEKKLGKISGWISFSLSNAKFAFPGVNNGNPFTPKHGRPVSLNLTVQYSLNNKLMLNLSWEYRDGVPYTPYRGEKNSARGPAYHRLDLALFYSFKLGQKWKGNFYFQIFNAYNRKNVIERYIIEDRIADINSLPFLPSFGLEIRFD